MKTLLLKKQIMGIDHTKIAEIIKMMGLSENAPWRKDSMEAYLTRIGKNPKYWTLYEALGIRVKHTPPVTYPTYRVATFDDIETLWKTKVIGNFVAQTHIFDDPGRPATYALLSNRYEAIHNTSVLMDYCVWNKQLEKLKNLARTAYWNASKFETHYDRIVWARELLKPIECIQILALGKDGKAINERLEAEDATYTATVDFWRGLIDPEYFTYVGREIFEIEKKESDKVRYNFVSMATPVRSSYAKFLLRVAKEEFTMDDKNVILDTLKETTDVPSVEYDAYTKFAELVGKERESLLSDAWEQYFVNGQRFMRVTNDLVPKVLYNVPYPILFFCGLIDMLEIKEPRGVTIEPRTLDPSLHKYTKTAAILGYSKLKEGDKVNIPADLWDTFKSCMMYSSYTTCTSGLSDAEAVYTNNLIKMFKTLFENLSDQIPSRMILSMPVVKDGNFTHDTLACLNVRIDRPEYDIAVKPTSVAGFDDTVYASKDPTLAGVTHGIPQANLVYGLFSAATMYFQMTAPFKPYKEVDFPRSTKWRGEGVYVRDEFDRVITNARDAIKQAAVIEAKAEGLKWTIQIPLYLSTETFYSPDAHLRLLMTSTMRDLVELYGRIKNFEEKKYLRRQFLKVLIDIGSNVKKQIGVSQHSSFDDRAVKYHELLSCVGYARWYYNFVFDDDIEKESSVVFDSLSVKDFEYWVDTWG